MSRKTARHSSTLYFFIGFITYPPCHFSCIFCVFVPSRKRIYRSFMSTRRAWDKDAEEDPTVGTTFK